MYIEGAIEYLVVRRSGASKPVVRRTTTSWPQR
jgi:hypothetical protein